MRSASSAASSANAIRSRSDFDVEPVGRACLRFPGPDLLAEANERAHGLPHAVSDRRGDARQSDGLPRHDRSLACAASGRRPKQAMCAHDAGPAAHDGRVQGERTGQDPARRSLRHRGSSSAGHRPGRRRVLDLLPGRRNRHHQGIHRRRAAFATSTSRSGSRAKAWTSGRSPASTTTRRRRRARRRSLAKAYHLRSLSIDNGLWWRVQRSGALYRAIVVRARSRSVRERLSSRSVPRQVAAQQLR